MTTPMQPTSKTLKVNDLALHYLEWGEAEAPPGDVWLCLQRAQAFGDSRETVGIERSEGVRQRLAALRRVELAGEPLGCDGVEVELAMWVASGREDEHRAPPRGIQLVLSDRQVGEHEPDEGNEQLAGARVESCTLECF